MAARGEAREQVRFYVSRLQERSAVVVADRADRGGNGAARLTHVAVLDDHGRPVETALGGEGLRLRFGYRAARPLSSSACTAAPTATVNIVCSAAVRSASG